MTDREKNLMAYGGYIRENGEYRFQSSLRVEPKIFLPAIGMIAGIVWCGVHYVVAWYWVLLPCLVIFIAGSSVTKRFIVEPANKVIREQSLLFARKSLSERSIPLSQFSFVTVEKGNISSEDGEVFKVYLWFTSGRKLFLKYYNTPRPAEELAWRVSCDTGIALKGELA